MCKGPLCSCRQKCEVLIDENRQLRKDLQEQETEMFKVHAQPQPYRNKVPCTVDSKPEVMSTRTVVMLLG